MRVGASKKTVSPNFFLLLCSREILLRRITVSLDSPYNPHIGDTSWSSIWCFIEFTRSACSCAAQTITSISFLRYPPFNHCHVLSVLTFSVSFRNLPWSGFSNLLFSSFQRFSNASGSSTSDSPFSQLQILTSILRSH